MLGAIAGDVIGSVYEFNNTRDYNFRLFSEESEFTDDTIMTIAIANWLLKDPNHSYQGLEDSMLLFAKRYKYPKGAYGTGFFIWLFHPEKCYPFNEIYGKLPYKSLTGRHPYGSKGNGSAMRVSPVGWFFDSLEETERVAEISARITHNHPDGIAGAKATAGAIWLARNGKTKDEIFKYIINNYPYSFHHPLSFYSGKWFSDCEGTVPAAIFCFLESTNYYDAIRRAVSLGGDSDTLACITGSIAEAFYKRMTPYIVGQTIKRLDKPLLDVLNEFARRTEYGKIYNEYDIPTE